MKIILLSILFFLTVNAQTAWYVNVQDTDSPWSGTAANPYKWFDNDGYDNWEGGIDWDLIEAGDTIYIDGGSDSTVIRPNNGEGYLIQDARISGGYVVITKDWRSGHNGDVYFMNSHLTVQYGAYKNSPVSSNVQLQNCTGLKFVGLNFIVNQPQASDILDPQSTCLVLLTDSLLIFEDCWINTNGVAGAVGMDTPDKITFENCLIESEYNRYTNDNDIFTWSQAGYGQHLIRNCEIINRNAYEGFTIAGTNVTTDSINATSFTVTVSGASYVTNYHRWAALVMGGAVMIVESNNGTTFFGSVWTDGEDPPDTLNMPADGVGFTISSLAHRDVMQMGYDGIASPRPQTKFINNFIWVLYSQDVNSWNQGHYLGDDAYHISYQNFVYINNIMVTPIDTNGNGVASIVQNWPHASSRSKWEFYNNTFVTSGGWLGNTQVMDTCFAYNNVFVTLNPNSVITLGRSDIASVDSINYNYWSVPNWNTRTWLNDATFLWDNYNYWDWTEWQAAGNDVNSSRDVNGTFEFQSIQDSVISAYIPPAILRDAGKDLSYLSTKYPEIMYDIEGNARDYGSGWDIGALEYTGATIDSTPSNVTFNTDYLSAELNTAYTGSIYNLTGFDSGYVHINRGWYNVDGGAFKSTEWTKVFPNDDVTVFDTTGSEYSTTQSIILTIGNDADTFTVKTKDEPSTVKLLRFSNGKLAYASNGKIIKVGASSYTPPAGEPDTTPPSPPTSFTAVGGTDTASFNCTWTNPSATDLDSIRYYEGSSNDTTTMVLVAKIKSPNTSYLRTGRATNTTYWCAVKAVDDSGNVSYFSNVDSAKTSTSASGTPLANLDLAYLTNSFAAHLYDHSLYGSAGSTDMQEEMTAYNTANSSDGSLTRISPDYPDCGDMIWHWNQVFFGGSLYSNTENVIDEYATNTYDILQVTFGFNSGDVTGLGLDTVNYGGVAHWAGNYKYWIRNMVAAMERYPDKYWILWNIPPVTVGSSGGSADALRHANFNIWMVDTLQAGLDSYGDFPDNVYVFDVFSLLKDPSSNFMDADYADGEEDSHPNAAGQDVVAPVYIQEVFDKARAYRIP